jgi:hypothetical protein
VTNTNQPTEITEAQSAPRFYQELVKDLTETLALGDFQELFLDFLAYYEDNLEVLKMARLCYGDLITEIYG